MTSTHPRAGAREWAGLAVLALPLLVLALDVSVLYLAAPALAADLAPSATQQLWILDAYGFLIAGFLITMGTLGDRIGRRRLLMVGASAFAVASVLAAFAPTAELLIAARALLGIAGATLMPSTLGLISTLFPDPTQRRGAVAIWMTTFSVGAAIGPLVGGVLVEAFWWGAVFLIGVPAMALLLVLGPRLLPEQHGGHGRLDLVSVLLSLATMLPLVHSVKTLAAHGPDPTAAVTAVVGLVAGVAFVRRQRRLPDPMLDVSLFTRRAFTSAVLLVLIGLLAVNGLFFLLPQYLQLVVGQHPVVAGAWMMPVAAIMVVGSLLTPALARRVGAWPLIAVSAGVSATGALALGLVGTGPGPVVVVALVAGTVLGLSPIGVLATDMVIGSVPERRAGSAAAISETAGELGVALGVAITGSLLTAVYTARLLVPAAVPDAAAAQARDGLAGAVDAAAGLPSGPAAELLGVARTAFGDGFAAVGLLGAGLLAVAVVLALTTPRRDPDAA